MIGGTLGAPLDAVVLDDNEARQEIEILVAMVAEECAKLCDARAAAIDARSSGSDPSDAAASAEADSCAAAIRAAFKSQPAP